MAAAEKVFAQRGFVAATVDEIAELADVAIGTLYHRFGSKEGIFLAVVNRALAVNERYMHDAYEAPGTPLERLMAAADAYVRFSREHPFYFRTVALPMIDHGAQDEPSAAAQDIAKRVDRLVQTLETLIREAITAGELRECDAPRAARFCWAAWNGVVATSMRPDRLRLSDSEIEAVLAEGLRIMLQGLVTG